MMNHRKPTTITKYYNSSPLHDVTNPTSDKKTIDNTAQLQLTVNTGVGTKSNNPKVNAVVFQNDKDLLYVPTVSRLIKKKNNDNSVRKTAILKDDKNTPITIDAEIKCNFGQYKLSNKNYYESITLCLKINITKLETAIVRFKHHSHLHRHVITTITNSLTPLITPGKNLELLS